MAAAGRLLREPAFMVDPAETPDDSPAGEPESLPDPHGQDGAPSSNGAHAALPEPDAIAGDEGPAEGPPPEEPEADSTPEPEPDNKRWYVVKVQSGREKSIRDAIVRKVNIEGLEEFFGQILIPTEKVTEVRAGKRVVKERMLYPGYLMCNVEFNDRILYLFRETSGVGDFVGGGLNKPPQPMGPKEVERMLVSQGQKDEIKDQPIKPPMDRGDKVRVRDGAFAGMEGEVKEVVEAKNAVKVEIAIFGRPVSLELEYWQVEII